MKRNIIILLFLSFGMSSCEFMFGSKQDDVVDDVLEQGAIDPSLVPNSVGYVPVLPIWDDLVAPEDVFIGYDEMVYVVDAQGLNIFDLKGQKHLTITIPGASKVTQDRMLRTYVCGRIDQEVNGVVHNLAAVYVMTNTAGNGGPVFLDTLIHPFNDKSRNATNFRGKADEEVEFAGVAPLIDNSFYLARRGPTNNLLGISYADNVVLQYNSNLENTGFSRGLDPVLSNLKSILGLTSITGFTAPPQLVFGMNSTRDFIVGQGSSLAEYKVLWIREVINPETGPEYLENTAMLDFDTARADRFLYASFRFDQPADICVAPDGSAYIFVVDSERDSLYQFTSRGYEGVNPPATLNSDKQILASFGGEGEGPFQFRSPSGVAYFDRTVYVADKGNNRVMRYRLSTDLE